MKNNYSINFYKAYSSWKSTLEDDEKYKGYQQSLYNKTSGESSLTGIVGNKILDLEWLETIEKALPYMDEAIRQSRSFIEQKDEIVPIEKVKRVNTQSIRHLAQHTNMIAKVEDNGDVMPDRILNIYYESSSAIYENRFLYTLLGELNDFVQKRYNDLKSKDERIAVKYDISKIIKRKNKTSTMSLEFEYKAQSDNRKVTANDDVSYLSGFDRVVRIRGIISDFYSLELIKSLHGVELVKPPIIQTNLLTKNVNFRTCVELWDYITRYTYNGYVYENKEFTGKMPKKTDNELADVFIFTNFLTEISFNTELKQTLEREYKEHVKEENRKNKEKLLLEEQNRKEQVAELLRTTVEKKTTPLLEKINALQVKNAKLDFKYKLLQQKHSMMLETVNGVMKQHRLIEQEQENIRNLEYNIKGLEEQIKLKNQSIVNARSSLNKVQYPITLESVEQEMKAKKEQEIKEEMIKFQQEKEREIQEQMIRFQQEKEQEIKEQVIKFNELKQQEINNLVMNFHNYEEQETDIIQEQEIINEELQEAKIIKFPTSSEPLENLELESTIELEQQKQIKD